MFLSMWRVGKYFLLISANILQPTQTDNLRPPLDNTMEIFWNCLNADSLFLLSKGFMQPESYAHN